MVRGENAAFENHQAAALAEDPEAHDEIIHRGDIHISRQDAEQFARVVVQGGCGRDDRIFRIRIDVWIGEDDLALSGRDRLLVPGPDARVIPFGFFPADPVGEFSRRLMSHIDIGKSAI